MLQGDNKLILSVETLRNMVRNELQNILPAEFLAGINIKDVAFGSTGPGNSTQAHITFDPKPDFVPVPIVPTPTVGTHRKLDVKS